MIVSLDDTVSVLRKWRDERRLIQVGLISSIRSGCHVIGRIEKVDEESLRVDARSITKLGIKTWFTLEFRDAKEFRFEDWREAPPEYAEEFRQIFEAFLFLDLGNCHCEIYAYKTGNELDPT
jgi:hypothetical protein